MLLLSGNRDRIHGNRDTGILIAWKGMKGLRVSPSLALDGCFGVWFSSHGNELGAGIEWTGIRKGI